MVEPSSLICRAETNRILDFEEDRYEKYEYRKWKCLRSLWSFEANGGDGKPNLSRLPVRKGPAANRDPYRLAA